MFLINAGFVVFTGLCIELCRAAETGQFSIAAWVFECLIIVVLGIILNMFRKPIG